MRAWKFFSLVMVLFLVLATSGLVVPLGHVHAIDQVVTFPDANLEAAIREAIPKPVGDIYASELASLTGLNADERGIVNLSGLEHCTNLTWLHLYDNQISDLSPLAGLTNLTYLGLSINQISNLTPLSGLTNLNKLWLGVNQISNLTPLGNLTNLTWLYLYTNQISDLTPLSGLTNLNILWLSSNQISDLSPLAGLTNLNNLALPGNQISDLSPLSGLTNLTDLTLTHNQISDLSPLSGLTSLNFIGLTHNQINIITPLSGLTNLTELWLNENQITNITPLAGLSVLSRLRLDHNQLSNITPLAGLTNLFDLNLNSNQISDIVPLVDNAGISAGDTVDLQSNPLSHASVNVHIPALQARGVTVLWDNVVPTTIYVPDDYATIQAAVDAASPGNTIIVRDGTYTENVDVNTDHLTILSENGAVSTIVQAANSNDDTFKITAGYVNIDGFTIKNAYVWAGIRLNHADNCIVSNNNILDNGIGVCLEHANFNSVTNNNISDVGQEGIHLDFSSNNTIINNTLMNCGLRVIESYENTVEANTVNYKPLVYLESVSGQEILEAGQVVLVKCDSIVIEGLDLSNATVGVELWMTNNSEIKNNNVQNNYFDGIFLSSSNNNTITNNKISNSFSGIYLGVSNSNTISNNTISNNNYGIWVGDSYSNKAYLNNLINNTENVASLSSTNIWNSPQEVTYIYNGITHTNYLGNFWSDYAGSDGNGDGIGDTPYNIDSDRDNYPLMQPFENYETVVPSPSDILLDVPPFNQNYIGWRAHQLGSCQDTYIGRPNPGGPQNLGAGCATTSKAMVFNYFHPNYTDPDKLNADLTGGKGYLNGCEIPSDLEPNNIGAPPGVECVKFMKKGKEKGEYSKEEIEDEIDQELQRGYPLIAKVKSDETDSHYVVITGQCCNTYCINDPSGKPNGGPLDGVKCTLDKGVGGSYEILSIREFHATKQQQEVTTSTGTGTATFSTNVGGITGLTVLDQVDLVRPPSLWLNFPHGYFSFNVTGITPGSTVTVTITFPTPVSPFCQYWKCINGQWIDDKCIICQWVDYTSLLGDNDGDNILTLRLTDGGQGDADGVANGRIVDPGGPAIPAPALTPVITKASPAPSRLLNPAQMSIQYLNINPQQTYAGQTVTIATNVVNSGDEAGNYNVILKINGQMEQQRMVSVGPRSAYPVKFIVTKSQSTTYTVDIGEQRGSFIVLGADNKASGSNRGNGLLVILIFGMLAMAIVVIVILARRRA